MYILFNFASVFFLHPLSTVVVFLFVPELRFTGAINKWPQFPKTQKFALAAPIISNRRPAASHVDCPKQTLLTVRPARQDAVLLRRMTNTALDS